ncbi:MAG TPA: hypothetical protein VF550_00540 [Polyangia bacterium]
MSAKKKPTSSKGFRCAECGKGNVLPFAIPGRQARHRTLSLPVPADLEIPTCNKCGTEWIGDSVARKLDAALEKEFRVRMRDLVTASLARLSKHSISKAHVERVLGLSQGYLSHLTTTGDKTPSEALALNLVHFAQNPQLLRRSEALWKKLSGAKPSTIRTIGG